MAKEKIELDKLVKLPSYFSAFSRNRDLRRCGKFLNVLPLLFFHQMHNPCSHH